MIHGHQDDFSAVLVGFFVFFYSFFTVQFCDAKELEGPVERMASKVSAGYLKRSLYLALFLTEESGLPR